MSVWPISFDTQCNSSRSLLDFAARNAVLKEPLEVAQAVLHLMSSGKPKRRYLVTPDAQQAAVTIRAAMQRVVQLNEGQPYSYSRDELVALLEELLETNNQATWSLMP